MTGIFIRSRLVDSNSIRVAILFRARNVPRPELRGLQGASHPEEVPAGYLRSIFRPFGIVRRRMDTFGRTETR